MIPHITTTTIEQFRDGNLEALKTIYEGYKTPLFYFAVEMTKNRYDAEDVVAESFIKLWKNRAALNQYNIKAYLYMILRNSCVDHIREKQKQPIPVVNLQHMPEPLEKDLMRLIIETDLLKLIYTEVENLPPKTRTIFKMIFIENLSYKEIAEQLNISHKTVATKKQRAVEIIKQRLLVKKYF